MIYRKGQKVIHRVTGWRGWIYGAGPGRLPARWQNPGVLYVDWFHRKPTTGGHAPADLKVSP